MNEVLLFIYFPMKNIILDMQVVLSKHCHFLSHLPQVLRRDFKQISSPYISMEYLTHIICLIRFSPVILTYLHGCYTLMEYEDHNI